jgi:hypothetical protein
VNLAVQGDERVSREDILDECGRFIDTVEDKFLFLVSLGVILIEPTSIRLDVGKIVVFLVTESKQLELLLMGDLGGFEEDFLW